MSYIETKTYLGVCSVCQQGGIPTLEIPDSNRMDGFALVLDAHSWSDEAEEPCGGAYLTPQGLYRNPAEVLPKAPTIGLAGCEVANPDGARVGGAATTQVEQNKPDFSDLVPQHPITGEFIWVSGRVRMSPEPRVKYLGEMQVGVLMGWGSGRKPY